MIKIFGIQIQAWLGIPLTYFVWVTLLFSVKRIAFKLFQQVAARARHPLGAALMKAVDFPLTLLIFVSGGAVVERLLPLAMNSEMTHYFLIGFKVAAILAIVLFVDRMVNSLLMIYSDRVDFLRASGGVLKGVIRAVVIALGVLILLDSFGVSITPVLASLGIGSLAVALALQPTLENFFSGIQIVIDKPIQTGHFVKLESGEEGYIHKIGWRSTWVRMLPNNIVVMPNKLLVNSKITNYHYPDKEVSVLVQVGVHYQSDLEQVERVTVDVARDTMLAVPGGVKDSAPFIRYHTFDQSSVNFSVIMRAQEFVDSYMLKHEFIKRLHRRYSQEGIVIPFPIVAVNYAQEKSEKAGL